MNLDYWHVYTDGSAMSSAPCMGGWAFVRISPDGARVERSGSVRGHRGASAERMEIMAVVAALASIPVPNRLVVVHTDCAAVLHWAGRLRRRNRQDRILQSWLHAKFKQLIQRHRVLFVKEGRPTILHPENRTAHWLARKAAGGSRPRIEGPKWLREATGNPARWIRFPASDSATRVIE